MLRVSNRLSRLGMQLANGSLIFWSAHHKQGVGSLQSLNRDVQRSHRYGEKQGWGDLNSGCVEVLWMFSAFDKMAAKIWWRQDFIPRKWMGFESGSVIPSLSA